MQTKLKLKISCITKVHWYMHQPRNFVRRFSHVHDSPMNEQPETITQLQLLD